MIRSFIMRGGTLIKVIYNGRGEVHWRSFSGRRGTTFIMGEDRYIDKVIYEERYIDKGHL